MILRSLVEDALLPRQAGKYLPRFQNPKKPPAVTIPVAIRAILNAHLVLLSSSTQLMNLDPCADDVRVRGRQLVLEEEEGASSRSTTLFTSTYTHTQRDYSWQPYS